MASSAVSPVDFSKPKGEAALLPPDSVQWRVYKNQIALGIGGIAAVLLEFAELRIRSGVWDHSTYKADPIGRSRRTGMVALLACYRPASKARAAIGAVNRMHGRVSLPAARALLPSHRDGDVCAAETACQFRRAATGLAVLTDATARGNSALEK